MGWAFHSRSQTRKLRLCSRGRGPEASRLQNSGCCDSRGHAHCTHRGGACLLTLFLAGGSHSNPGQSSGLSFPIYSVGVGTYAGGHQGALRARPRCSIHEGAQVWGWQGVRCFPGTISRAALPEAPRTPPAAWVPLPPALGFPSGTSAHPHPTPSGLSQPRPCGPHSDLRVGQPGWLPHLCRDPSWEMLRAAPGTPGPRSGAWPPAGSPQAKHASRCVRRAGTAGPALWRSGLQHRPPGGRFLSRPLLTAWKEQGKVARAAHVRDPEGAPGFSLTQ